MTTFWLIFSMIIIGAFVGSSTNALAIKMLFRPHQPKYIGKWKIPFTPGIIPKRRQELANQLGKLVMNHLVTSDGIKNQLTKETVQKEIQAIIQTTVFHVLSDERTLEQWFKENNIPISKVKLEEKLTSKVKNKIEETLLTVEPLGIREILPEEMIKKWENKLPYIANGIIQRGANYFEGPNGREVIRKFYQQFLEEKQNSLANMMQMFLKTVDIAPILQPEIIKFLESETTKQTIEKLLQKEYEELLTVKVGDVLDKLNKEEVVSTLLTSIMDVVSLDKYFHTPLNELFSKYSSEWSNQFSIYASDQLLKLLLTHTEGFLEKMELEKMVQNQVESFPTEKLEQIILEISEKELKMITILGGVLGGAIGLIQGLISVLFL